MLKGEKINKIRSTGIIFLFLKGNLPIIYLLRSHGAMALGRSEYGRLGLGDGCQDAKIPTLIKSLAKGN